MSEKNKAVEETGTSILVRHYNEILKEMTRPRILSDRTQFIIDRYRDKRRKLTG